MISPYYNCLVLLKFISPLLPGTLRINYMMDLNFGRIDEITFNTFNIRNRGSMIMNNGEFQHRMYGNSMQVSKTNASRI